MGYCTPFCLGCPPSLLSPFDSSFSLYLSLLRDLPLRLLNAHPPFALSFTPLSRPSRSPPLHPDTIKPPWNEPYDHKSRATKRGRGRLWPSECFPSDFSSGVFYSLAVTFSVWEYFRVWAPNYLRRRWRVGLDGGWQYRECNGSNETLERSATALNEI